MTTANLDRLYAAAVTARGIAAAAEADAATAVAAANAPGAPPWALADAEYAVEAHRLAVARANAAQAAVEDAEADAAAQATIAAEQAATEAPLSPGVLALVKAVQDHAHHNYERGGWDVIVETFTDGELAAVIAGARTPAGAIRKAAAVARLHGERRREVEATAW